MRKKLLEIRRTGGKIKTAYFNVYYLKEKPGFPTKEFGNDRLKKHKKIGFIIRKTTGNAVQRNRIKRVVREQLRKFLPDGDYLVAVKCKFPDFQPAGVSKEIKRIAEKI